MRNDVTNTQGRELAEQLGSGLLSFPVTPFGDAGEVLESRYCEHLEWQASHDVAGLFAAGGTGEFFSLTPQEVHRVVGLAVASTPPRVPIIAPAGGATRTAQQHVRSAEEAGAAGILLFPPYLTTASDEGFYSHVHAVLTSTTLPVILYGRSNGVPSPAVLARLADACPNLIGYKDGSGNLELMAQIVATVGDRLLYIGGLPTAETIALPYLELGVTTYSSAMFNFIPDYALEFYADVRARNREAVHRRVREFVLPYLEIRDRTNGYAVSIIKAGLDAVGRYGGPVRPPLSELTAADRSDLSRVLERARLTSRVMPATI